MSSISETFKKRKALITYITAGDPTLGKTEELVYVLEKAGADIVELGVPFSDPLADGPVIQASHQRALKHNTSLSDVFKLVKKIRKRSQIPLVLMLSDNLILQYGEEKFYQEVEASKIDGVIVPDLPPEESKIAHIYLVAPTSTDERIKLIAAASTGFIYLVSLKGVTGKRSGVAGGVEELVNRVKKFTDKPVAVGFGISTPAQVKEIAKSADGVIVGSALVDLIAKRAPLAKISKYISSLRRALDVG